jgi:hypothetical protein
MGALHARDAVADLEVRDARADGDDIAGSVAARDGERRAPLAERVLRAHNGGQLGRADVRSTRGRRTFQSVGLSPTARTRTRISSAGRCWILSWDAKGRSTTLTVLSSWIWSALIVAGAVNELMVCAEEDAREGAGEEERPSCLFAAGLMSARG